MGIIEKLTGRVERLEERLDSKDVAEAYASFFSGYSAAPQEPTVNDGAATYEAVKKSWSDYSQAEFLHRLEVGEGVLAFIAKLEESNRNLTAKIEEKDSFIAELNSDLAGISNERNALRREKLDLAGKIKQTSYQFARARSDFAVQAGIALAKTRELSAKDAEIVQLRAEIESLKNQVADFSSGFDRRGDEILSLKHDLNDAVKARDTWYLANSNRGDVIAAKNAAIARLQKFEDAIARLGNRVRAGRIKRIGEFDLQLHDGTVLNNRELAEIVGIINALN